MSKPPEHATAPATRGGRGGEQVELEHHEPIPTSAEIQADLWLPPIERMSGWAHESIWFIERQRLADMVHERDGNALLRKLHGRFRWTIPHHRRLVREMINTWTTSTDDLDKLTGPDWDLIRLEGEKEGYRPIMDELHGNFLTLISEL